MPRKKNTEMNEENTRKTRVTSDYFLTIAMDGGTCGTCQEEYIPEEDEEGINQVVLDGTVIWRFKKMKDLVAFVNRNDAKSVEDSNFIKLGCGCLAMVVQGKTRTVATRTISTLV